MNKKWTERMLPRNRDEAYKLALEEGLIRTFPLCRGKTKGHQYPMKMSHYYPGDTGMGRYRCPKSRKCRPDISVSKGTWFEESRLSPDKEFRPLFGFAHGESYERIKVGCQTDGSTVADSTISAKLHYCREVVSSAFSASVWEKDKIGGPGIVVQIDESKFGKRKYNRGRVTLIKQKLKG